nr:hypothetical protein [Tanacetum cinerariifolium]
MRAIPAVRLHSGQVVERAGVAHVPEFPRCRQAACLEGRLEDRDIECRTVAPRILSLLRQEPVDEGAQDVLQRRCVDAERCGARL